MYMNRVCHYEWGVELCGWNHSNHHHLVELQPLRLLRQVFLLRQILKVALSITRQVGNVSIRGNRHFAGNTFKNATADKDSYATSLIELG